LKIWKAKDRNTTGQNRKASARVVSALMAAVLAVTLAACGGSSGGRRCGITGREDSLDDNLVLEITINRIIAGFPGISR
jgi:hypothetical protein